MGNNCCADKGRTSSIDEVVFKTLEPKEKESESRPLRENYSVHSDVYENLNYDEIDKHNVLS